MGELTGAACGERGLELSMEGRECSGPGRVVMLLLEWKQGDSSMDLTSPSTLPSIWHLVLKGMNKIHKYFIFMT